MDSKILDASAFYAGVPFRSSGGCYTTTSLVYDEIKHIKKNHDALGTLLEANRLKIREPGSHSTSAARKAAKDTGDFQQLSKQDISIIALCIETNGEIISDDFAVSNVARNLGLRISPVMTAGIKDVGKWVHYCPGCKRTSHSSERECPVCGNPLRRKLLRDQAS